MPPGGERGAGIDPGPDAPALFIVDGPPVIAEDRWRARVRPTAHARGPWDHGLLHGGPVCGLAAHAAEQVAGPGLHCARLTLELLAGVPLEPLAVTAVMTKPGRRTQLIDVTIGDARSGRIAARAFTQWAMPGPGHPLAGPVPVRPREAASPWRDAHLDYPRPGFNCDAAELRYVVGSNEQAGPATIWIRLVTRLVDTGPLTPLTQVATAADLAAAAGWEPAPDGSPGINPDLTLQLGRYPTGPWIALAAVNRRWEGGVGFNDAVVYDGRSRLGTILQTLVTSPWALTGPDTPSG
ncbi:MAG: acyl-CoA thioesterase domain-containing protein [Acidimicrobiales bacterium]